ncbi:cell cycle checkpoint protein RAD17-like isoform X2 [Myxocyprinus asiaticus]|uniref:cell cycle checkpoint protein RAD17-like isoform X2 n=1 Tax=Myxocyprinus asiaticus TaxID=70543 RepID=UPI0022220828|nr:cell cycle checkpoint protein RAD17-like isoform X2 [Myxocyprinus asiaticus]
MMSKLSLAGKQSSGKIKSWVEPSFGEFLGGSVVKRTLNKGPLSGESKTSRWSSTREQTGKTSRKGKVDVSDNETSVQSEALKTDQHEPWVDMHAPQSQAELAIHKKKVEEVESWLRVHLDKSIKGGAILLLTGPSGCGKTATVQVLAKDLGFQIQEWSNPSTTSQYKAEDMFTESFDPESRFNRFHGSSQTGLFQEFLLRANKYNRLQMSGEKLSEDRKIILIEEFPNQFYRHPGCLHDILRQFSKTGRCPLVFIVSDSLSGDKNSRLLFKEVLHELKIHNICFNPVSPTSMMKVLSCIVTIEARKSSCRISLPDKTALEFLCSGSSGDIRSAINSLQFSSFTGSDNCLEKTLWASKKSKSSSVKTAVRAKGRSKSSTCMQAESPAIGGKDASLFLFRALGKILYCKRESDESSQAPKLPPHLTEHQRDKLLVDPELVIERSHMSGEFFNLYLHQNYLDFFSDVEDIARASEYLSDADFLTAEWSSRSTMLEYGSSVATRGLMHSNSSRAQASSQSTTGFKPLHKPHWLYINKMYRENYMTAHSLFINFCLTPVSLLTELVPYLAKLTNPLRNQAQITFIQNVGHLSQRRVPGRLRLEALGDKDPGILDTESDNEDTSGAQSLDPGTTSGNATTESNLPNNQDPSGEISASQPQLTSTEAFLDEEDLLIEEFDSD